MKNVATFEIIGRISRNDAYDKVTRITTCSNYRFKDAQSGEWKDDPHWNQVVVFNQRPREAAAELRKGDLVKITGRLRQSSYMKDGERVFSQDLIAWSVELVSKPKPKREGNEEREAEAA